MQLRILNSKEINYRLRLENPYKKSKKKKRLTSPIDKKSNPFSPEDPTKAFNYVPRRRDETLNETVTERSYGCPNCCATFDDKVKMIRHKLDNCSTKMRFKCPYCLSRRQRLSDCYNHVKKRHSEYELYCMDVINKQIRYPGKILVHTIDD